MRGGGRRDSRTDAADERQLEAARPQADVEPEDVELQAVDAARGDAQQTAQGELVAPAAGSGAEDGAAEVVLADGGGRKVDFQLRHGAGDPGGEGVQIGP